MAHLSAMEGTGRRLASTRSLSGPPTVPTCRPRTGCKRDNGPSVSHCLSSRCGLGAYNSREDDDSCFASTSEYSVDRPAARQLPGSWSTSSPQPSGWIRMDPTRQCLSISPSSSFSTSNSSDMRLNQDARDSGVALPFAIFPSTSAGGEADHAGSSGSGVSGPPSLSGSAAAAARASSEASAAPSDHLWTLTDQPGVDMFLAGPHVWGKFSEVFVILFGVDGWDTEGIYSLRAFSEGEALPQETIIAFESEEDAQRYAGLLEATMDHVPYVCGIAPRELLDFCLDEAYHCRMEPAQSLLIPPDCNVGMTDWERSLRLREGQWAVLPSEPAEAPAPVSAGSLCVAATSSLMLMGPPAAAAAAAAGSATPAASAASNQQRPSAPSQATLARYVCMSGGELDNIRGRLERLLQLGQ